MTTRQGTSPINYPAQQQRSLSFPTKEPKSKGISAKYAHLWSQLDGK